MTSYSEYLQLDKILSAQQELSSIEQKPAHDEMLFIITHQTYELWFKQILHELKLINNILSQDVVPERSLPIMTRGTRRVTKIFKLINQQIDILETMTPMDFLDFRSFLGNSSGFQSAQFRELEVLLGREFTPNEGVFANLTNEQNQFFESFANTKSLLANVNRWLEDMPFLEYEDFSFWSAYEQTTNEMLNNKLSGKYGYAELVNNEQQQQQISSAAQSFSKLLDTNNNDSDWPHRISKRAMLSALFISLYRQEPILYLPYVLLSSLIDIDEQLTIWRQRHVMMVQRMMGNKIGTGGSSGHAYLYSTIEKGRVFSDLYQLGNFFIPNSQLPKLPDSLKKSLGYCFSD